MAPLIVLVVISVVTLLVFPSASRQLVSSLTLFWGLGVGLFSVQAWGFRLLSNSLIVWLLVSGAVLLVVSALLEPFVPTPVDSVLLATKLVSVVLFAYMARRILTA